MIEVRAVLRAGGPLDAANRERLARRATSMIPDKTSADDLRQRLLVAMLAGLNGEVPGPCGDALTIVDEIEAYFFLALGLKTRGRARID